ncbi:MULTISPECIES: hypothetical protein [unclassified Fibrobacter]|uniref:c-type cytochrome n=1 Tax=unclassified Fibrobacter TaxID=2634177 RepID=UPI0025B8DCA8|nr:MULTISPECIES: hypothetical protein [unclassified Fibrobacter]
MISRVVIPVVLLVCALFAADVFVLPAVTPELKAKAGEYYNNECKGCHRWARKFAAPPMKDNVAQYVENPEALVQYLMKPEPKHPDQWDPMEISPMSEADAKMMASWLLYILEHPDDLGRPK